MTEYQKQAKEFLESCNAKMIIKLIGTGINPDWGDNEKRNKYMFAIKTPLGLMTGYFWDSVYNTKRDIKPTEYDILACLEKYDVGTIDDFVNEFGYEVHEWADVKRIENTYNAVIKEYQDICRIFTPEQIEMLREVQ